jgi:beta-phosphoglucomutase
MKIKGCVFDMDGVIVDTADHHYDAWRKVAKVLGHDFTQEMNEKLKGISRMDSLNMMLDLLNTEVLESEKDSLCALKNQHYLDSIKDLDHQAILPGIEALLDELAHLGIKYAIGSASKNAHKVLELIGLKNRFDVIIDGHSVSYTKPNPEVFLKAAKGINVKPSEAIVIEDSHKGLLGAVAGGFRTVGIGHRANLPGAEVVYSTLQDVTFHNIINALNTGL